MNQRDVGVLASRALAVFVAAGALRQLPTVVLSASFTLAAGGAPGGPPAVWAFGWLLAWFVLLAAMAGLLWFRAEAVGRRMLPPGDVETPASPVATRDLLAAAVAVLGLYLAVEAIPAAVETLGVIGTTGGLPLPGPVLASLAARMLQLALGLWLFLGSGWFARSVRQAPGCDLDTRDGRRPDPPPGGQPDE